MARKIFYFGGAVISSECNDADVTLYLDNSGITDQAIRKNICLTVKEFKQQGVWEKIDVFYPDLGANADQNKLNVVNPLDTDGAFRRTFHGGVTFSPITGTKGNGTNGYYDTKYNPSIQMSIGTGGGATIEFGDLDDLGVNTWGAQTGYSEGANYFNIMTKWTNGNFYMSANARTSDRLIDINNTNKGVYSSWKQGASDPSLYARVKGVLYTGGSSIFSPPIANIYGLATNFIGNAIHFSKSNEKGVVIYKDATQSDVIKIETALANMNSRR